MRRAYLDFETYYSNEYSLSRMTPAEYINDPRYETLGAACAFNDEPGVWLEDQDLANWIASVGNEPTIIFSHNALFDAVIMAWKYGLNPTLWGDTLGMARGVLNGVLKRFSLASVSEHLGLGHKGGTVLSMKGYNKAALHANTALYAEAKAYAINDMDLCRKIERALAPSFPVEEYLTIDTLIRAVTEPMLMLDMPLVYTHIQQIQQRKLELLQAVALDVPATLMSNQKFAEALENLGVEPPMKISKTTGKETYAFAKTDLAMEELSEHENPKVQALVAARLGHKSTQEETRSHRFIAVAQACNQMMVAPMAFSAAHTHRLGGTWKMNMQNLGRDSLLRKALVAPPGYKVVSVDASQIEARLGAWLAGWEWLLDQFRDPTQDPYSNYATMLFGFPVSKANKLERFVGKQSILSLQYGASWRSLQRMCRVMGGIYITEEEAKKYVSDYRRLAKPITNYWKVGGSFIEAMHAGNTITHKCLFTSKEKIHLPSGLSLRYPDLWYEKVARGEQMFGQSQEGTEQLQKFSGWRYGDGIGLFGGKVMENCIGYGTLVLTQRGWVAIQSVGKQDILWDGCAWVGHAGVVCKGVQDVLFVDGVSMTPDHEVATEKGWVNGAACEGLIREGITLPYCHKPRWNERGQADVVGSVRVWCTKDNARNGLLEGQSETVWLQAHGANQLSQLKPRHVEAPGILGMAVDARQVQAANTSGLGKLRRAWYTGVLAVGKILNLLARHGANIHTRADLGATEQQRPLHTGKLSVGHTSRSGEQQTQQPHHRNPVGLADNIGGSTPFWNRPEHTSQPSSNGSPLCVVHQAGRKEQVFDVLDAGPRNRFVVLGETGPFVVHNCCQALAAVIVKSAGARIRRKHKIPYKLQVHDELVYVVPEEQAQWLKETVIAEMSASPPWAPDIPLAAEGGVGDNYGECK